MLGQRTNTTTLMQFSRRKRKIKPVQRSFVSWVGLSIWVDYTRTFGSCYIKCCLTLTMQLTAWGSPRSENYISIGVLSAWALIRWQNVTWLKYIVVWKIELFERGWNVQLIRTLRVHEVHSLVEDAFYLSWNLEDDRIRHLRLYHMHTCNCV